MNKKNTGWKRFLKKSPLEFAVIGLMLAVLAYGVLPGEAYADETNSLSYMEETIQLQIQAIQNKTINYGVLPTAEIRSPEKTMSSIPVTAYNSVPWQTDATPCIGAQGTDICAYLEAGSNTCAANFVPLGTVLEVEGLGTCVVRDRMNARYFYRVDWYMGMDVASAKSFGVQYKEIGVYPS
ncbi:MAG: hypothetical protein ABH826_03665 [Patescibacteria group bacterium]